MRTHLFRHLLPLVLVAALPACDSNMDMPDMPPIVGMPDMSNKQEKVDLGEIPIDCTPACTDGLECKDGMCIRRCMADSLAPAVLCSMPIMDIGVRDALLNHKWNFGNGLTQPDSYPDDGRLPKIEIDTTHTGLLDTLLAWSDRVGWQCKAEGPCVRARPEDGADPKIIYLEELMDRADPQGPGILLKTALRDDR
jgi:hypothetical protein